VKSLNWGKCREILTSILGLSQISRRESCDQRNDQRKERKFDEDSEICFVMKGRRESGVVGFTDAVKRRGGKGIAKASIKVLDGEKEKKLNGRRRQKNGDLRKEK
jgi:hypothetical protein